MPGLITSMTLAAGVAVLATGCSSDPVSFASIRDSPSPEMSQLAFTKVEGQANMAVMKNQNLRMAWDDVLRAWHLDHPSRLSPYPILYTSGNPR